MSGQDTKPPVAVRFAPLLAFFHSETAGGAVLLAAAAAALLWANSPVSASYFHLLRLPLGAHLGHIRFVWPLQLWVNDGLMSLFFLLVSLEIRRETTQGELASPRRIAAPALAAIGGVVLPAVIYSLFNWSDPSTMRGWAIPVATDIAFSLGVLSLLGRRIPVALKMFLASLAIIDDLIAIVVIAVFYTRQLAFAPLVVAVLVWLALLGIGRVGVCATLPFAAGGLVIWAALLRSGIEPTLAGVALASVVPAKTRAGPSVAARLETSLNRLVPFLIVPLFGIANAGFSFGLIGVSAFTSPVLLGIAIALVAGKQIGVFGAIMAACKLGIAQPPGQLRPVQLYGAALLCGIGFTMSLFIGNLAFRGQDQTAEVKLAVLLGSMISALAGLAVLALTARSPESPPRR